MEPVLHRTRKVQSKQSEAISGRFSHGCLAIIAADYRSTKSCSPANTYTTTKFYRRTRVSFIAMGNCVTLLQTFLGASSRVYPQGISSRLDKKMSPTARNRRSLMDSIASYFAITGKDFTRVECRIREIQENK